MKPVVVLAVSMPDFHLAVKWLWWAGILAKRPVPDDRWIRHNLIVMPAASVDETQVAILDGICDPFDNWYLHQQEELYERPEIGYGAGANALFKSALETVERMLPGHPMLFCEADTVPMRAGWVDSIEAEYIACGKPFMGAFQDCKDIPHMSGNAVYPPDWREKAPSLALLPFPRPEQGWDSMCAHDIVPQMHVAKTIQQEWICPPFTEENVNRIVWPTTALFHRTKDGTLIDVLARRAGYEPPELGPQLQPRLAAVQKGAPVVACYRAKPRVDILIVTHAKDMEFLKYCLLSIRAFAREFGQVVLLVPERERGKYDWTKRTSVQYFHEPEGKGMMAHEIEKCRSDEHCPNADFILHMDADCMFMRPTTPDDFVQDWRCLSVCEPYAKITNKNRFIWRDCVKTATGLVPTHDYMVRHPQVHPRDTYYLTRSAVEKYTGRTFNDYVLSCQSEFPQGFAEFPTLSTVGRLLVPSSYNFREYDKKADVELCCVDPSTFQYVYRKSRDHVVEFWSHGGIDSYRSECEGVIHNRVREFYVK